jgi:hypothetical protein
MMRSLAEGPSTKWVIPMELTSFVQGFARNMATAATTSSAPPASNGGSSNTPPAP